MPTVAHRRGMRDDDGLDEAFTWREGGDGVTRGHLRVCIPYQHPVKAVLVCSWDSKEKKEYFLPRMEVTRMIPELGVEVGLPVGRRSLGGGESA